MPQIRPEIIEALAKKYNLPKYKIEDVINSHFQLAAFVLRNGIDPETDKYPTIGIPHLGKFYAPRRKRERYNEIIRAKKLRS